MRPSWTIMINVSEVLGDFLRNGGKENMMIAY